jgi:hypothetical protein
VITERRLLILVMLLILQPEFRVNAIFLVSDTLLNVLNLSEEFQANSFGKVNLRGKSQNVELYNIKKVDE